MGFHMLLGKTLAEPSGFFAAGFNLPALFDE
jgi:hypothetical protein